MLSRIRYTAFPNICRARFRSRDGLTGDLAHCLRTWHDLKEYKSSSLYHISHEAVTFSPHSSIYPSSTSNNVFPVATRAPQRARASDFHIAARASRRCCSQQDLGPVLQSLAIQRGRDIGRSPLSNHRLLRQRRGTGPVPKSTRAGIGDHRGGNGRVGSRPSERSVPGSSETEQTVHGQCVHHLG